jgi:hypothetical protein
MLLALFLLALSLPAVALITGEAAAGDEPTAATDEPAEDADTDQPVTILYTIHNAGYVEPCG